MTTPRSAGDAVAPTGDGHTQLNRIDSVAPPGPLQLEIAGTLVTAAVAVAGESSLASVARPFLDLLHRMADFDSVYLTEIRPAASDQVIRFADNRGIVVPEGLVVDWEDSLCRRAFEAGVRHSSDTAAEIPGASIEREFGVMSYTGVPVVTADNVLLGTLCGVSSRSQQVSERLIDSMQILAGLIADQWQREREQDDDRERAERVEEQLVERATFLAEAEHLMKSPLTVLRGWSELLADEWETLEQGQRTEALQTMRQASRDASEQLERLLEEARGEVLSHRLAPERVALDSIVADVVGKLRMAAGDHLEVTGHWPPPAADGSGTPEVIVDRYALWQVLWHLGENAVKYSPDGGSIDFSVREAADDTVCIEVRDEGLGVPPGIDIFAPFVRGDDTDTQLARGTGLGLHIVSTLVRAMGGTVTAHAREPRGSLFRVLLPAATPDGDNQIDAATAGTPRPPAGSL